MNYEVLVNRNNRVPDCSFDLIRISTRVLPTFSDEKEIYIEKVTYNMWTKLVSDAKNEGYDFEIVSAYRTAEYQQKILEYYIEKENFNKAIMRVSIPNYSEHQTGLAIDYSYFKENNENIVDTINESDNEFKWIITNMYKYGFILRYPKDKMEITGYTYEPWHIRYVGIELAKYLTDNNLSLEEYHQKSYDK